MGVLTRGSASCQRHCEYDDGRLVQWKGMATKECSQTDCDCTVDGAARATSCVATCRVLWRHARDSITVAVCARRVARYAKRAVAGVADGGGWNARSACWGMASLGACMAVRGGYGDRHVHVVGAPWTTRRRQNGSSYGECCLLRQLDACRCHTRPSTTARVVVRTSVPVLRSVVLDVLAGLAGCRPGVVWSGGVGVRGFSHW